MAALTVKSCFLTSAESEFCEISMVEFGMVDIGKLMGARASVGMEIESGELASRFESDSASTKLAVLVKRRKYKKGEKSGKSLEESRRVRSALDSSVLLSSFWTRPSFVDEKSGNVQKSPEESRALQNRQSCFLLFGRGQVSLMQR